MQRREAPRIPPGTAAIVLTGGGSTRMGSHKPALPVGGRPIIERVLGAVESLPTVVVGLPYAVPPGVPVVREDPPGSGPVAGIAAGLAGLDALVDAGSVGDLRLVAVLAGDLPFLTAAALADLAAALEPGRDADRADAPEVSLAAGPDGAPNWLCAVWRVPALRRRLAALGDPSGTSVRRLTSEVRTVLVADHEGWSADVDSPEDLDAARARARRGAGPRPRPPLSPRGG
ncbi:MAG TPA: NTP transferase domain-containing protein [Intrasporangium sp.]|uniref:molybdenum cofactor guanylyltransferase n=1 Tax=Intrasporangium sp. TaxID=1925024 RepID=UPI002D77B0EA|nr:NTP transferase domain-containing protein [Intrasporangium sp.]HET7399175.1 NTP transferase domain-containing protein [Intrasporangium sp.]